MAMVLLQVNFDVDFAKQEKAERTLERAGKVAEIPGLIWKVWLRDPERGRGGGIYLFEDEASAHAWGDGRFETMAERMPWTSNIRAEYLRVEETLSSLTRAIPPSHSPAARQAAA